MSHLIAANPGLVARVRRIVGQLGAVERSLTTGADCAELLHRVAAVRGAVNGLLDEIIAEHLDKHVSRAGLSDAERRDGADDLLAAIRRYAK